MKSSQLIKIDSISSGDSEKKKKTVVVLLSKDVLEPLKHFERERPIQTVYYMSNELWVRIKRYTNRTLS